jgi:hypothetical protein
LSVTAGPSPVDLDLRPFGCDQRAGQEWPARRDVGVRPRLDAVSIYAFVDAEPDIPPDAYAQRGKRFPAELRLLER